MLLTKFLQLKKPEGADPVNVQDFNENADTLDTEINARVKSSGGDIANTKVSAFTASTASYPVPAAGETPKVFMGKIKKFFEDIRNVTTGACFIGQIVNNCVTDNAKLPLSAAQGKELMDLYTVLNTNLERTNNNLAALKSYSFSDGNFSMSTIKEQIIASWPSIDVGRSIVRYANSSGSAVALCIKEAANYGTISIVPNGTSPSPFIGHLNASGWIWDSYTVTSDLAAYKNIKRIQTLSTGFFSGTPGTTVKKTIAVKEFSTANSIIVLKYNSWCTLSNASYPTTASVELSCDVMYKSDYCTVQVYLVEFDKPPHL